MEKIEVAIIMGSDSDWPKMEKCMGVLKRFDVGFEVKILSAHRTLTKVQEYMTQAETHGVQVFIGAAGKAAHLPGVMAACTIRPVIGIPIKASALEGMDALLSIVQMPTGIPVATVAIDGAENAALLAIAILANHDPKLEAQLIQYRKDMEADVLKKNEQISFLS